MMADSAAPDFDTCEDSPRARLDEEWPWLPHLFVIVEGDRPEAAGARYSLAGCHEVRIGRGSERAARRVTNAGRSRLEVTVTGRALSAQHARLEQTPEGWVLEDCQSTNACWVNGKRVSRALLHPDDVIELGHTLFALRPALPTPPGTPDVCDAERTPLGHPRAFATLLPGLAARFTEVEKAAGSALPLLLLGATGTGKEWLARGIHQVSGRPGPFVAVNCGALASGIIESQLFGHMKGAFSGATRDEPGYFRASDRGTLLLDEIGDLPIGAQTLLLRVLQEKEVVPLGSSRPVGVDLRVLAATHRPLGALVRDGRFRSDLFARLDGCRFQLPPLAEHREDLGLLASEMLRERAGSGGIKLDPEAARALVAHDWPFNIRELGQRVTRALVFSDGGLITKRGLGLDGAQPDAGERAPRATSEPAVAASDLELERALLRALEANQGNISGVARSMGKARMQIQRWLKRFAIDPAGFRNGAP
jgi:transcriptional regulator of acetoin/glycerol metabolism